MIEEVSLITKDLRTRQLQSNERSCQYFNEPMDLTRSMSAVAGSNHPIRQQLVEFRAVPSSRGTLPCHDGCTCNCHYAQVYRSSPFLNFALGRLFLAYSGSPIGFARRCSSASCTARSGAKAYMIYAFPSWFCTSAVIASFMTSPLGEPSMSLAVRRVVPKTAELFLLANSDDGDGIRRLISSGMASPMDIQFETGRTALHVSLFTTTAMTILYNSFILFCPLARYLSILYRTTINKGLTRTFHLGKYSR